MMLGKRPRPPIKRTTSMTEFTLDLNSESGAFQPSDPFTGGGSVQRPPPLASPRLHRRNSADSNQTAHFLRVCSLCKRRLIPGRDIYMYRGDSAFCSLECRQRRISQDDSTDKGSPASGGAAGG